ncbi:ABC transporter permease [Nocardioides marmorisolisilvae]|uniref:Transport permease protein n=1 Tax=Nocardioides marmorisolisilvae TaxID=1542737 RepID=A0A3N0DIJ2_9ACTN|nr:ABC transporter permease [Nocardioides marmorisolisilvae]RNL75508.1 ABC transporter permease [Nocardioides marmorisolisilvae]
MSTTTPSADPAGVYAPGELSAYAAEHGLTPVGVRPPLKVYLQQTWQRRHFIVSLAASKAYIRNQGGYLGQLWAIITPALWACVYLLIFGVLLNTSRGIHNFVGFLVVGVFLYHFSTACISQGAKSISMNQELIGSLQFPRAVLPAATVLAELFTLIPAIFVMIVVVIGSGEHFQASWLLLPFAVILQWIFGTGFAFFFARMVVQFRDFGRLVPFVLRALMYTSGVFFSISHYVGNHVTIGNVLSHQPIAIYLELGRGALLEETQVTLDAWLWGFGWAFGTLALGFIFFWRAEEKYARG